MNTSRNALVILIIFVIIMPIVILIPPVLTTMQCGTRSTPLKISGSTALFPLVDKAAQEYTSRPCFFTHIQVVPSNSQDGLTQLSKNADIGPYPFWSIEHMYTKNRPDELTQKFIAYMYSTTVKSYIKNFDQYGYIDISDIPRDVLKTHSIL